MSAPQYRIGQGVIVDGLHCGEIIGDLMGGFYRVEVDAGEPKHEFWTVKHDRMEPSNPTSTAPARAVETKLKEGSIHIVPPGLTPGDTLSLNRQEGRYFITPAGAA